MWVSNSGLALLKAKTEAYSVSEYWIPSLGKLAIIAPAPRKSSRLNLPFVPDNAKVIPQFSDFAKMYAFSATD